jgi:hypothetical protein
MNSDRSPVELSFAALLGRMPKRVSPGSIKLRLPCLHGSPSCNSHKWLGLPVPGLNLRLYTSRNNKSIRVNEVKVLSNASELYGLDSCLEQHCWADAILRSHFITLLGSRITNFGARMVRVVYSTDSHNDSITSEVIDVPNIAAPTRQPHVRQPGSSRCGRVGIRSK